MDVYPGINEPNFQFSIAERLEFRNLRNVDNLYYHQEFVRRFLSPFTPYKCLILFHSLGSGKSIACISIAVDHYLFDKKKCIVVTKGDSGTENFKRQVQLFWEMSTKKKEWDESIFSYKHYISLSNYIKNISDENIQREFSNKIIILDEVHNIRYCRKIVKATVYSSILKLVQLCHNFKLIMATATPMTDNQEQIKSLLSICNYHREDKNNMNGIISYNEVVHDRPKSVHIGTDKYIKGLCIYTSDMIGHQKEYYKEEHSDKPPDDIYRTLTHISLFCFDDGTCGRKIIETKMNKIIITTTITSMSTGDVRELKYVHYTIKPEFKYLLYGDNLRNCSSKYSAIIDLIENSDGNIFIFLEEVKGSGLLLLAAILEQHGYTLYNGEKIQNIQPKKRYTMCVGSVDICPNNNDRLDGFNSDINKNGDYIRVLLGSRVIGESITLKNVRNFHCLTPHWNDSTINQAIGRVIRNGSHNALEKSKRSVNIYIHASLYTDDPPNSVDILKLHKSKEKELTISKVETMMKSIAVDRYCLVEKQDIEIKYVTNYAIAYIHNCIGPVRSYLCNILDNMDDIVDIDNIITMMNIHPIICKEVICKFIFENELFVLADGKKYFIRAFNNYIFKVQDPSLPFILMPKYIETTKATENLTKSMSKLSISYDIYTFRYISMAEKILYLEQCILTGEISKVQYLKTLYINYQDTIYHFLLYRDLNTSYTSSNPIPKKPLGKTRMFRNSKWENVTNVELECKIFDIYKECVTNVIYKIDHTYDIYGIISIIDGDMRIRLRSIENKEKSDVDFRYIRRGRNMKSIRKELLLEILQILTEQTYSEYMSINEIIECIDSKIIEAGIYMFL